MPAEASVRHLRREEKLAQGGAGPWFEEATHVASVVAEKESAKVDDAEDARECWMPLRPGGTVTRVWSATEVPELVDEWLWNGRVPTRHVTAIVGPKGAGKSYLVAELVAKISSGDPWPDEPNTRREPAKVLVISAEDELPNDIMPRLRACGANFKNVRLVDFREEDGTPGEITPEAIEMVIDRTPGLKLIVVDPFANMLGASNDRRLRNLRTLLYRLARMAAARGIAIVLVNATDKVSTGKMSPYGVDVVPFLNAGARAVWSVDEDPAEHGRFLWLNGRNNFSGGRTGLAFRVNRGIAWDPEPVELNAEELKPARRPMTKVARAADWLRVYLAARPRTAVEVRRDAALAGISRGALYEAKGVLGIPSDKETDTAAGRWHWVLPEWCREENESVSPQDSNILARFAETLRASCNVPVAVGDAAGSTPALADGSAEVQSGSESDQTADALVPAEGKDGESPEDSKIMVPVSDAAERARGGVGRPTVAEEGGVKRPAPSNDLAAEGGVVSAAPGSQRSGERKSARQRARKLAKALKQSKSRTALTHPPSEIGLPGNRKLGENREDRS